MSYWILFWRSSETWRGRSERGWSQHGGAGRCRAWLGKEFLFIHQIWPGVVWLGTAGPGRATQGKVFMRTIHLSVNDLIGFREAVRDSRDETLIVHMGPYRYCMGRGEVLSAVGHSELDVTPVEDDGAERRDYTPAMDAYGPRPRTENQHRQFKVMRDIVIY